MVDASWADSLNGATANLAALRCRSILLDFFLIKLFQEPAAAQEFVTHHLLTFTRWLVTPPPSLVDAIGRADVSSLGFVRTLLNATDGANSVFRSQLAQFSTRDTGILDLTHFREQVRSLVSEFSTNGLDSHRILDVLSGLTVSAGLTPPCINSPIKDSGEKFVSVLERKVGFDAIIQAPEQSNHSFDLAHTVFDVLSPMGEILLESPRDSSVGSLAVSAYEFGVEQAVSFGTKTKLPKYGTWALSSTDEKLAVEKTQFNLSRAGFRVANPGFTDSVFLPVPPANRFSGTVTQPALEHTSPIVFLENKFTLTPEILSCSNSGVIVQPDADTSDRTGPALHGLFAGAENGTVTLSFSQDTQQRISPLGENESYPAVTQLIQDLVQQLHKRSSLRVQEQHQQLASRVDLSAQRLGDSKQLNLLESLHTNTLQFALQSGGLAQLRSQITQVRTHTEVFALVRTFLDELPPLLDLPRTA